MDPRTKRRKVIRTLAISFGIVLILGSLACLGLAGYGIWETGYYFRDREDGDTNVTIAFLITMTAIMLASGLSLVLGPSKIKESEPEETKAQAEAGSKPRTIVTIFGIILLLAAVLFGCLLAGGSLYAEDWYSFFIVAAMIFPIAAILVALVLASGIRLVFGPYKIPVMYAASAISLAIMSLAGRPWFVGYTTGGYYPLAPWWILLRNGGHTNFNLYGLLFVLPCLGAVLFSVLWARKSRKRVLRTISWICGIVGGLGAILAVVDLIRFLSM